MTVRTCVICGMKFMTESVKARFCSVECKQLNVRVERYRKKYESGKGVASVPPEKLLDFLSTCQTCPVCRRRFYPRTADQRCCNWRCSNVLTKREKRAAERPPLTRRKCDACGKEFQPDRNTMRFCSQACRDASSLKRLHALKKDPKRIPLNQQRRICKQCGQEFTPSTSNQKCCSVECSAKNLHMLELNRQNGREGRGGGRSRGVYGNGTFEKKCEECGRFFVTSTSHTKFCSDECRYKRDQRVRERKFKENNPMRECAECGKWFQPTIRGQVTCSVECRKLRRKKFMDSLPNRKHEESKLAVQRARDLLMAEKAAMLMASDSIYDKMLQMSPDELREAYEKLNATERKEFERYYVREHSLQTGGKIVRSFRKRGEGEESELQMQVKAMKEGRGYTSKKTKQYIDAHREKYREYARKWRQRKKQAEKRPQ